MFTSQLRIAILLLAASPLSAANAPPTPEQLEFFEQNIRPLLVDRCYECHSHAKKIKGSLALDSRVGWQAGGDSGTAIIPGEPDDSLLIKAVRYHDADLKMPPAGKLKDAEIRLLEQWVKDGAADPRDEAPAEKPKRGFDEEAAEKHWAYQPLQTVAPPAVKQAGWAFNEIDLYVLAGLEQQGFQPSADAERAAWLRRVTFDLTGLPPTADETAAFLADQSADPYAAVVDRLLASRPFGERWARPWLDLVGYADQIGSANDVPAEYAWRYRDYVIDTFAADKPFNQFVREQIAGDLLTAQSIEERQAQLTATGFLVLGNINIVEGDKLVMRMDIVDQQIEKVGKAFLGMTLNCVRCHDHKFDPISVRDYYGLAGIFASTESTYKTDRGVWSSVTRLTLPETLDEFAKREAAQRDYEKQLAALTQEKTRCEQRLDVVRQALPTAPDSKEGQPPDTKSKADLEQEQAELNRKIGELQQQLWHANYLAPQAPIAFGVKDSAEIADTPIQIRGNPHAVGEIVPRGFVRVATHGEIPGIPTDHSGRLQLADWLTGAASPLVARVTVNRAWQKLFGRGLASSVDYLGLRSEPPSHPELLDHLARQFLDDGWSYKRMLRPMVLSRTYRQSSHSGPSSQAALVADPGNVWLWRMSPRRLDAEMMRDAVLQVSGQLQPFAGGPALNPEFRENVGGLNPKDVNPISFSLRKFRDEQSRIRTIYLPVVRSSGQRGPADVLNFFDFAQPAQLTGSRPTTAVSSQALFLLNGPLFKEAAQKIAGDVLSNPSFTDDHQRLATLFLNVWNRPLTAHDETVAMEFLNSGEPRDVAWQQLVHALLVSNEFLFRL
ncbi:MAG: DUF1549 domain-containing protein [Planctomycetaceae bacterium]